jgi:hypothetical protein
MTPQERQLVDELFEKLARLEASPRDPDAESAIAEGLRRAPHALYPLVQTVLVQDEALRRADARIRELGGETQEVASESFLDSMRAVFGGRTSRGSVPSVRQGIPVPPVSGGDPRFANAAPMQNAATPGQGGSSFLGTAAAAAAGYIGGAMLMNSIGSLFGSNTAHAATPQQAAESGAASGTPWDSGAGNSDLARDAGADRIGDRSAGLYADDQADDGDFDNDFGGDFGGDL